MEISCCLDFDGLQKEVKKRFGKKYEVMDIWKDENEEWQILIEKRGTN